MATVGFTEDGKAKPHHAVSTLSGGWRMKLAMARAMLQRADILLLDEVIYSILFLWIIIIFLISHQIYILDNFNAFSHTFNIHRYPAYKSLGCDKRSMGKVVYQLPEKCHCYHGVARFRIFE